MARFFPRDYPDDAWKPLAASRAFAVRCRPGDTVFFRFGLGHGIYVAIAPAPAGRLAYTLDFETGDQTLIGKVPEGTTVVIGRTSECAIKIMHAIVSRQHVELELVAGVLRMKDMGSTNGTFLFQEIPHFDIESYLENHPLDQARESTLDAVQEAFGPEIIDFLKTYSEKRGQTT